MDNPQVIIVYKTPQSIINARKNYYEKNKTNPQYKQKRTEYNQKWKDEHKEEYQEKQRLYMREKRAKAKKEKEEALQQQALEQKT